MVLDMLIVIVVFNKKFLTHLLILTEVSNGPSVLERVETFLYMC
jgi:hypothetical protein